MKQHSDETSGRSFGWELSRETGYFVDVFEGGVLHVVRYYWVYGVYFVQQSQ